MDQFVLYVSVVCFAFSKEDVALVTNVFMTLNGGLSFNKFVK